MSSVVTLGSVVRSSLCGEQRRKLRFVSTASYVSPFVSFDSVIAYRNFVKLPVTHNCRRSSRRRKAASTTELLRMCGVMLLLQSPS